MCIKKENASLLIDYSGRSIEPSLSICETRGLSLDHLES